MATVNGNRGDIHGATLTRRQFVKTGGALIVGCSLVGSKVFERPAAAAAAAGRYAAGGYRTIYDGVVGPWLLPRFAGATGLEHIDYVVLLPTRQEEAHGVEIAFDEGHR